MSNVDKKAFEDIYNGIYEKGFEAGNKKLYFDQKLRIRWLEGQLRSCAFEVRKGILEALKEIKENPGIDIDTSDLEKTLKDAVSKYISIANEVFEKE